MESKIKRVLCAGMLCVDLIYVSDEYPPEDEKAWAISQHWQKGGNAANTAMVLAHLGSDTEYIGTFPDLFKLKPDILGAVATASFAKSELERAGVSCKNLALRDIQHFPLSSTVINKSNGTRSVVHCRGPLDELKNEDFVSLDLNEYCWIHFEGRQNVDVIENQIKLLDERNKIIDEKDKINISVELERTFITESSSLWKTADLVIVSKEYANHFGHKSALDAVTVYKQKLKPGAEVVCPWGHLGAAYFSNCEGILACMEPAMDVDNVMDTLGAGDTFNGSLIHAKLNGFTLEESVRFACRIAGEKIQNYGYDCIKGLGIVSSPSHQVNQ